MPQLPRFRRHQEQADDLRKLAKILLETGEPLPVEQTAGVTAGGDWERLRGLAGDRAGRVGRRAGLWTR